MQDKLVAAGRVVPVERLAKVEAERQHDHAEYRAHLEQEHVANNDFKQQMLESQKVILSNQRKLETRSIKLARRVEHLSAKKVGAGEDDNDAESHDNAEDSHSQLSWRPSRADPSTPTPSSSRRRRPLPTEASSPSSSASSRPELALAPPLARLSSTRPSTSAHQTAAYSVPSPGPSSSTEHARTRRRSAYTLTSGSSMAPHGIDDVLDNVHAKSTPDAVAREDVKLEVGAAEIGDEASSADEGDEASSSSDEADDTGHKLRRTSSGAKAAAAIADEDGEGTSLEHAEPEMALDARDSRSGSSTGTSSVRMAPRLAQRRYIPTRSIFEEAASRGDLPSPSASASREARSSAARARRQRRRPSTTHLPAAAPSARPAGASSARRTRASVPSPRRRRSRPSACAQGSPTSGSRAAVARTRPVPPPRRASTARRRTRTRTRRYRRRTSPRA